MTYTVYVITNENNKIYIGQTNDLEKRLLRHNDILPNKNSSYTHRMNGKWELVYQEEFRTRTEAIQREKQLKSYKGRLFIKNQIKTRGVSSAGRAAAF